MNDLQILNVLALVGGITLLVLIVYLIKCLCIYLCYVLTTNGWERRAIIKQQAYNDLANEIQRVINLSEDQDSSDRALMFLEYLSRDLTPDWRSKDLQNVFISFKINNPK